MSSKLQYFLLASCLLFFTPLFYAQEEELKLLEQSSPALVPEPATIPLQTDAPKSVSEDPLLSELTEMFLKSENVQKDQSSEVTEQATTEGPTQAQFRAAEMLLKAARVLESESTSSKSTSNKVETVRRIRALAIELLR